MKNIFIALAAKIALGFLQELAQSIWNALWDEIFEAIQEAEKKWIEAGRGELKKDWVLGKILTFIEQKKKMNFIQKWAVKVFLATVIDAIIKELNDQLGKDWKTKAENIKAKLAGKIPFVD